MHEKISNVTATNILKILLLLVEEDYCVINMKATQVN